MCMMKVVMNAHTYSFVMFAFFLASFDQLLYHSPVEVSPFQHSPQIVFGPEARWAFYPGQPFSILYSRQPL